jgi:hypothetical protein
MRDLADFFFRSVSCVLRLPFTFFFTPPPNYDVLHAGNTGVHLSLTPPSLPPELSRLRNSLPLFICARRGFGN